MGGKGRGGRGLGGILGRAEAAAAGAVVGLRREDGPGAGAGTGVLAVLEGKTGSCLSLRPVVAATKALFSNLSV